MILKLPLPYIQCKHYGQVQRPRLIVLHSMEENPLEPHIAKNVAHYFSDCEEQVGTHFCIDNECVIQCCQTSIKTFGARGCNEDAIHIEHAGYAHYMLSEWMRNMGTGLDMSAYLSAILCKKWDIVVQFLGVKELPGFTIHKGMTGITTHNAITHAFGIHHGHTDPGSEFPIMHYLREVSTYFKIIK